MGCGWEVGVRVGLVGGGADVAGADGSSPVGLTEWMHRGNARVNERAEGIGVHEYARVTQGQMDNDKRQKEPSAHHST